MLQEKKKKYFTQNTGYTAEERRLIREFRKCNHKEREIIKAIIEKASMHKVNFENLENLLK